VGKEFKYDVAFSFLDRDEPVAIEIANTLSDRVVSFIYSERQAELVGKNGVEEFVRVFKSDARLVVALFRDGWGETPWTRIEKEAIQDRRLVDTSNSFVLVVVDPKSRIPDWVPATHIWQNYSRFGAEGIAATIENRLRELGAAVRAQTVEDRASIVDRAIAFARHRKEFLESERAVELAEKEATRLLHELVELATKIAAFNSELRMSVEPVDCGVEVYARPFLLEVHWNRPYANTLSDSFLSVRLLKEQSSLRRRVDRDYEVFRSLKFQFSMNESEEMGWRETTAQKQFLDSKRMAEDNVDLLVAQVRAERMKELN
jgi:hypothetical protein